MPKDNLSQHCQMVHREKLYGDEGLLMHEKIWDILNFDKEGRRREHSCGKWYVRIAGHRTDSVATNSAATEHANDEDPFRKLAEDIFAHDLTAEQTTDPKYYLREGKSLTSPQRSLINLILRKNLGAPRLLTTYSSTTSPQC